MPCKSAIGPRELCASGLSRSSSPQAPPSSLDQPDGHQTDKVGPQYLRVAGPPARAIASLRETARLSAAQGVQAAPQLPPVALRHFHSHLAEAEVVAGQQLGAQR